MDNCAVHNSADECYAVYSRNKIRERSSSGGMFYEFASHILQSGGIVYGVRMSADCTKAEFSRVTTSENLMYLLGSKYIQAEVGDTYANVKKDLEEGKTVLFTGTPCQVNGLKAFLGKDFKNLICGDILCHGVPSQKFWEDHVAWLQNKHKAQLTDVNFRSKKSGWNDFSICYSFGKKKKLYSMTKDLYFSSFLKNYSLRPSCYNCPAKTVRLSDFSMGDFWGVDSFVPDLDDDRGVSLLIIRTEKGKEIFTETRKKFVYRSVSYKQGVANNCAEYSSVQCPADRRQFMENLDRVGYEKTASALVSQYGISSYDRMIRHVKHWVKRKVKRIIYKRRNRNTDSEIKV